MQNAWEENDMKRKQLLVSVTSVVLCLAWGTASAGERKDGQTDMETNAVNAFLLFDFSRASDAAGWKVQDDVVMGGRSSGTFRLDEAGHAVFAGEVSLENNGGFSSAQCYIEPMDVSAYSTALLRVKGDGKRYLFLVESSRADRHYYMHPFQTGHDWEWIEIPFADMAPYFRGDRLDMPNYLGQTLAQTRFMIANARAESFRLEIAEIRLK
jgi:hypothetical protein